MATHDVPGANAANADVLAMGAWAEHEDGVSFVLVQSTEQGKVVYTMFDLGAEPPMQFTDAMQEAAFKREFSWKPTGKSTVRWTWHDKTPFPWERVMRRAGRPYPQATSAEGTVSAAAKVAAALGLRGRELAREHFGHLTDIEGVKAASRIWNKIDAAVRSLFD